MAPVELPCSTEEALGFARLAAAPLHKRVWRHYELEDLTQEAFIAIMKAVAKFDPERSNFKTYAVSIARYRLIDFLRVESWVPRLELERIKAGAVEKKELISLHDEEGREQVDLLGYDSPHVESVLRADEVQQVLRNCGNEKATAIVALYFLDELTMKETAEAMGVSESRVCQVISQAIQYVREALSVKRVA
jgi:RNA polymerase sigma factor FliA